MTYRYQLYKCPICGTVTEIVHDGVSAMICCGKTMEVLDDREPVGTKESHMPVVEATEKGCKVSVGSKLHGMDADHLIEWAEIRTSEASGKATAESVLISAVAASCTCSRETVRESATSRKTM